MSVLIVSQRCIDLAARAVESFGPYDARKHGMNTLASRLRGLNLAAFRAVHEERHRAPALLPTNYRNSGGTKHEQLKALLCLAANIDEAGDEEASVLLHDVASELALFIACECKEYEDAGWG